LIPWTAVNLVDFYLVRRGRYALGDIVSGNGVYGRWAWRGLTAYAVGFAAMIPFFSLTFYTGAAASAMDGADMSFAVGLLVAGLMYFILTRRRPEGQREEESIQRSAEDFGLTGDHCPRVGSGSDVRMRIGRLSGRGRACTSAVSAHDEAPGSDHRIPALLRWR